MCVTGPEVALGFAARRYPLSSHICFLFDSAQARDAVLLPYLSTGLEQGHYIEYFADVDDGTALAARSVELGLDWNDGQLVASTASGKYCPDGVFVPDDMLFRLSGIHDMARRKGFAAGRIFAEMTWALRKYPGSEQLVEYEARINGRLDSTPATVICAYDTRRFPGDMLADLIAVHPITLTEEGMIMNKSPLTPEEYRQSVRSRRG